MTSPSSSSTIRSTPCVDGCCGPMLRIISWVPSVPWGTISISTPPPRTNQFSAAAVKAVRSSVSTGSILPRTGGSDQRARPRTPTEPPGEPVVGWPHHGPRRTRTHREGHRGRRPRTPPPDPLGRRALALRTRTARQRHLRPAVGQARAVGHARAGPGGRRTRHRAPARRRDPRPGARADVGDRRGPRPRDQRDGGRAAHGAGEGAAPRTRRAAAAAGAGQGYVDLEVDRATGARERRSTRAERLLTSMTGAESALVVNNGAAALLLTLASLARGKGVVVSRGELIEIGGEFRIPDIMAASGARLVEVGTTNRTRASDYRSALSDKTALILKVHPSNYRVLGFH